MWTLETCGEWRQGDSSANEWLNQRTAFHPYKPEMRNENTVLGTNTRGIGRRSSASRAHIRTLAGPLGKPFKFGALWVRAINYYHTINPRHGGGGHSESAKI